MGTLDTLLKVAQSRLDEVSREASVVAERMADLNRQLLALDQRRDDPALTADVSLMIAAGDFRGQRRLKREALQRAVAEQREVLDEIRARLTMAFREKSKFEQLLAQENVRAAQVEGAREQKLMDEAALRLVNRH